MSKTKSYCISKEVVMEAYKLVKANKGSSGIDNQTIEEFEQNWKDNLYKLWNKMSSGSYFPKPVKRVNIPKGDGKMRPLGIPTVTDRIAQMIAKLYLENELERIFVKDSYGYRPNKSAIDAVGKARERCWKYSYVIDLDIKGFFDNIDHELMMKAVKKHTEEKWIILYVERWLKTSVILETGEEEIREKGTPQGGVISPILANLYLHYAIDKWLEKKYPTVKFERYADDMVLHSKSREEAEELLESIKIRLKECKLELHPEKTKIVYCRDEWRREETDNISFDFLGYTFKPRRVKSKSGKIFTGFNPAISKKAKIRITEKIKWWKIHLRSEINIEEIAEKVNKVVRGWINYYGKFYKSELSIIINRINLRLVRWVKKKYRKSTKRAIKWLINLSELKPNLFSHWENGFCSFYMIG